MLDENFEFVLENALLGINQINIHGLPNTQERLDLIEEAIKYISTVGPCWYNVRKKNFGFKRYCNFGDQRSDYSDGMGPKHGCIVFEISKGNEPTYSEGVYLLLLSVANPTVNVRNLLVDYIDKENFFNESCLELKKLNNFNKYL